MTLRTIILVLPLGLYLSSTQAAAQERATRAEPASKAAAAARAHRLASHREGRRSGRRRPRCRRSGARDSRRPAETPPTRPRQRSSPRASPTRDRFASAAKFRSSSTTPSTRRVTVIDGQGAAPRLATLDHFKGAGGIPAKGIEPAAVPAALDACLTLLDRFGTMTFTQVIAPTKKLLRAPTAARALARRSAAAPSSSSKPPRRRPRQSSGAASARASRPLPRPAPGRRRLLSRTDRASHRRLGSRTRAR